MELFFHIAILLSQGLSLFFLGFCLVVGAQALCCLAEDFPRPARRTLQGLTGLVLLLHLALLVFDHIPLAPITVGCFAHAVYYLITLREGFPLLRAPRLLTVAAITLFVLSNILWARELWHFYDPWIYSNSVEGSPATWREGLLARNTFSAASFMLLCVWLLPLGLVLVIQDGKSAMARSLPITRTSTGGTTDGVTLSYGKA